MSETRIYLPDLVGGGYGDYWRFRGRYDVVKGSRGSKKSKTTALRCIYLMMAHEDANLLVVRKTYRTLKDSCFAELKWAIHQFHADAYWRVTLSPLEMTYVPTGQKIYFRGLDDPLKIASITVHVGYLCWGWIEEAYEILNEHDFDTLDESIRGKTPPTLWKQWMITFNPWNERHWLKSRFYDVQSPDILAKTTTYLCNEWLDERDRMLFEEMRLHRPDRYRVAGLGEWGQNEGTIFHNFTVVDLSTEKKRFANVYNGLDFGVTDPNALIRINVDSGGKRIYVFDEYYRGGITLDTLADEVKSRVQGGVVTCDSAGKQQIMELCRRGVRAIGSRKGAGSIEYGILWLQGYDIIIDKECTNFIREISGYRWQVDKYGKATDLPVDEDNHLLDALRYAVEPLWHTGGGVSALSVPRL